MPKHASYVPKHRDVPQRSALRSSVRTGVVYSGVAVVATGISVSTGVLNDAPSAPAAASDLSASASHTSTLSARDLAARDQSVSRSADDRRATAVQLVKKAALSDAAGAAKTNVERINSADPKALTRALMPQFGMSPSEFGCIDRIWSQESGWNVHAANPTSSAYGIPQALPGSKMSSAGPDWANSAETQIKWGLGYIRERYGSACNAWGFKSGHGWY